MATLLIVEPIFEADFTDCSYGFIPGRRANDALDRIREHLNSGRREVYDADLKGYFDSLDWDLAMRAMRHYTDVPWILLNVERWLRAPV